MSDPCDKSTPPSKITTVGNDLNRSCFFDIFGVLLSGITDGNKNDIKGNGNNVVLIGKSNNNTIDGSKNLVAARGTCNTNKTTGNLNKVGQKGKGNSNLSEKPTTKIVVYQEEVVESGKGQAPKKKKNEKKELDDEEKEKAIKTLYKDIKFVPRFKE